MTPKDVLKMAKEKGARIVDLRFIDLPGLWQHFSIPISELSEGIFEDGLGFDGSSIRGSDEDESDMLVIPDASTAQMDPFTAVPTLVLICHQGPGDGEALRAIPLRGPEGGGLRQAGARRHDYQPRNRFSSSTDSIDRGSNYGLLSTPRRRLEQRQGTPERPTWATSRGAGATSRCPMDHSRTSAPTWSDRSVGIRWRHHEVATGGRPRSTCFDTLTKMADRVCW